jgi:predicted tellurium resistance membrane protein TerC
MSNVFGATALTCADLSLLSGERMPRRTPADGGIGIAVLMRIGAVVIGAEALEHMSWLHYVLGIILLLTAYRVWRSESRESESDGGLARWAAKLGSPALAATVALGLTDLLFAIDSIPASFGITTDPAVIITANGIALAALWAMYGGSSILAGQSAASPGCGPLFAGAVEAYPAG